MIRWLGRQGLNAYVFAPKDDPYQRETWRELYPADHLARFRTLVGAARAARVRFVYSISPGLDMCYSSEPDRSALAEKLTQLVGIGVRSFMLAFDDIPRTFHCEADVVAYKSGDAALGRAHAAVSNTLLASLRGRHAGVRLIVVPSDYAETVRTPYLGALASRLSAPIDVVWTGPYVVPSRISTAQADAAARVYGRRPLLWDNYPVNDYARYDLHLGPLAGRAAELPQHLSGYLSNPMNEAEASKIPLYTVAAYLRLGRRYRPEAAWLSGIRQLVGASAARVLRRLADNSQSTSTLDDPRPVWRRESPELWRRALLTARALRGPRWEARLTDTDRLLRPQQRLIGDLTRAVRWSLAVELDPWTREVVANADLGRAALRYVAATRPRLRAVRVRHRAQRWKVTGRLVVPDRAELVRLRGDLETAAASVLRSPKETHGGSIPFLLGLAVARESCAPTAVRLTLDGRPVAVGPGGRFTAEAATRPRSLLARDRRGSTTAYDLVSGARPVPGAAPAERRARRQVAARLGAIAAAVRREDLGALGRYVDRSYASVTGRNRDDAVADWNVFFTSSRFSSPRFPLAAFEAGALRCGGPVVAQVTWQLVGKVPLGVPIGKDGNGTIDRPSVLLLKNRGSARAPDWRIVYAMPDLPSFP